MEETDSDTKKFEQKSSNAKNEINLDSFFIGAQAGGGQTWDLCFCFLLFSLLFEAVP